MEKNKLRALVKERRRLLSETEVLAASERIAERLLCLSEISSAEWVFCYAALGGEVQLDGFIESLLARGKRIALPRVEGRRIRFYEIEGLGELRAGAMGIREPAGGEPVWVPDAPVVMPGLAFDWELNRVGFGGGFYDGFLREEPGHFAVAVAFDWQVFDRVPSDPCDIRPEVLVTESRLLSRSH